MPLKWFAWKAAGVTIGQRTIVTFTLIPLPYVLGVFRLQNIIIKSFSSKL